MRSFNIVQIMCWIGVVALEMEQHQLFYICKIVIVFACKPYHCSVYKIVEVDDGRTSCNGKFKYLYRQIFAVSNDEDDVYVSACG